MQWQIGGSSEGRSTKKYIPKDNDSLAATLAQKAYLIVCSTKRYEDKRFTTLSVVMVRSKSEVEIELYAHKGWVLWQNLIVTTETYDSPFNVEKAEYALRQAVPFLDKESA